MRVTKANIEALKEAMEEVVSIWGDIEADAETWLEAQEPGSGIDADQRNDARSTVEGGLDDLRSALVVALTALA